MAEKYLPAVQRQEALVVRTIDDVEKTAKLLCASGCFGLINNPQLVAQACVKIIAGAEMGFPPYVSLSGIHVVEKKDGSKQITPGSGLISAAILRSGRYRYRVIQHDEQAARIEIIEGDTVLGEATFTLKDAERQFLLDKTNWKKMPRQMLFARAMSEAARTFCPDVFCGPVYSPEDFDVATDGERIIETEATPEVAKEVIPKPTKAPGDSARKRNATHSDTVLTQAGSPVPAVESHTTTPVEVPSASPAASPDSTPAVTDVTAVPATIRVPHPETSKIDLFLDGVVQLAKTKPQPDLEDLRQLLVFVEGTGATKKQLSDYLLHEHKISKSTLSSATWKTVEEAALYFYTLPEVMTNDTCPF